tara:strand:- start:393 stop:704 length:312 start_codon:yes stop_codon:yes gene_type:complete
MAILWLFLQMRRKMSRWRGCSVTFLCIYLDFGAWDIKIHFIYDIFPNHPVDDLESGREDTAAIVGSKIIYFTYDTFQDHPADDLGSGREDAAVIVGSKIFYFT